MSTRLRWLALCALLVPSVAYADDPPPPAPVTPVAQPTTLLVGQHFVIDPVADGVMTATGLGFAGLLGLILQTGEIKPQAADPNQVGNLLSIDRGTVDMVLRGGIQKNAGTYSNIGLYTALAFTAVDTVVSGVRDGWDAGIVDAVMYAESLSLTLTLTDVTKIAVRRPRPIDYAQTNPTSTDVSLAFFSGHASTVAAITGTASYLAFMRSPNTARPWITLIVGTLLTAFVSYERVMSGEHFPTDVIAGSLAGGAVGVLVPHLHRHKEEAPAVWVGTAPATRGSGATLILGGRF
jgi:undecaprenyl-diphosphatase